MNQIHTHYVNLKVARNAPPEVIRAAYKVLSQKWHPDRNPSSSEAARIMAILNSSYDVLSNPDKRQEHDHWIAQQERLASQTTHQNYPSTPIPASEEQQDASDNDFGALAKHIRQKWIYYGIAGFLIYIWTHEPSSPAPGPKPYAAAPSNQTPTKAAYVRPVVAPNGQLWPTASAYVKNYPQLHTDGLSTVIVDNTRNDSDVFVKLVSLDGAQAYPVRHFFIPAFSNFSLNKVTAGSYDIRYRDLSSGGLSRSEAFNLEETPTYNGTQFSNMTMTLYKVQNGNMKTYGLPETEF